MLAVPQAVSRTVWVPTPRGDPATSSQGSKVGVSPASERRRRLPMLRRCFRPKSCTWKRKWSGSGAGDEGGLHGERPPWHQGLGIAGAGCQGRELGAGIGSWVLGQGAGAGCSG